MSGLKNDQSSNKEPLDEDIDGISNIDSFAWLNRLLEDNPEFKSTYDSVMGIFCNDSTEEEETEVERVEIDGHDYIVAKRIEIVGNTYLYLVSEDYVMFFTSSI